MLTLRDHTSGELFDPWKFLGPQRRRLLEQSWAGVFRDYLLGHLPVKELAASFRDDFGRPSKDLSIALGALILQQLHDLTDRQTTEAVALNIAWHYALDIRHEPDAYLCERTLRNYRRKILEIVRELYGVEVSATLVSAITEDLDAEVSAWRTRPLSPVWPIVYFDGITVHVRGANARVSQHTIYVALGVNLEGRKELLGLWLGENEGAKFWLACLTDLQNHGLRDIFVACIDGLSGFAEAIHAAYPETSVQLCIVHLVRAALRYVSTEDSQLVARDLKKIYQAATVLEAEAALDEFAQAWDAKYPTIAKQWRAKWANVITLFDFPPPIRKAIYTTNAIESVNSVIRKFTRNRKIYPNEDSTLKLVFMAIREAAKKWTMPIHHWKQALNHFAILYEDRMRELTNS